MICLRDFPKDKIQKGMKFRWAASKENPPIIWEVTDTSPIIECKLISGKTVGKHKIGQTVLWDSFNPSWEIIVEIEGFEI